MAIGRPNHRSMQVTSVKRSGGDLHLAKGQLAVVNLNKANKDGAEIISTFAGIPKDSKTLAIRVGSAAKPANRTHSDKGLSTQPFSLNEVEKILASAPTRTEQIVDEVILGYDGFDPSTSFKFKKGQAPFHVSMELSGGALDYRGAGYGNTEILNFSYDIPGCDPVDNCDDCNDCAPVDCKLITMEMIELIKNHQVSGGALLSEFVEVTPVMSCDSDVAAATIDFTYFTLDAVDTGDSSALADVQAQYTFPVVRINRSGAISKYETLVMGTSAPADYTQSVRSLLKGCEDCPAGFTAQPGGLVYAITIEDSGADRTSVIETNLANGKYITGTLERQTGNSAGTGLYVGLWDEKITTAEITAFVSSSTSNRNTATVQYVSKAQDFCNNSSTTSVAWTERETCTATEEKYRLHLRDKECGQDLLPELRAQYPNMNIVIANSNNSSNTITLTGTSGTANVSVGGTDYLATYGASLSATAAAFVASHGVTIYNDHDVTVTAVNEVLTFEGPTATITGLDIVNATGDLDGTIGTATELPAQMNCYTQYEATVVSNIVCEECADVYRDYYQTSAPAPFMNTEWELVAAPASTGCLCGIRLKGKTFLLSSDEPLRDWVGFTENSTLIRATAGFPDKSEIREGIGFIDRGSYKGKYVSRFVPRTHLMGNLRHHDRQSMAYFLNQGLHHDYMGRVLRGEEAVIQDNLTQIVQYTVQISHNKYSQSLGGKHQDNNQYIIEVPLGAHQDVEDYINELAASAGVAGVKV